MLRHGYISIILFFVSLILNAQSDWQRWEGKEISYELRTSPDREFKIDDSGIGISLLSISQNAYYFLISDLDGDNCPFYPSCSKFFMESVKETNILTGTLMFADRFTRDMNPFKGYHQYPSHPGGKYYDPPYNYKLNLQSIKL